MAWVGESEISWLKNLNPLGFPYMELAWRFFVVLRWKIKDDGEQGEIGVELEEEREEEGRPPPEPCADAASCFGRLLGQRQMESQEGRQPRHVPLTEAALSRLLGQRQMENQ